MVKMLLRDVAMSDLAEIYERNADRSPAPYLKDAEAVERARGLVKSWKKQWTARALTTKGASMRNGRPREVTSTPSLIPVKRAKSWHFAWRPPPMPGRA